MKLISNIVYYIAYGLHLGYTISIFKEICRKPMSLHPGLGSSLTSGWPMLLILADANAFNTSGAYKELLKKGPAAEGRRPHLGRGGLLRWGWGIEEGWGGI